MTPFFPSFFVFFGSVAYICKGIAGMANGASRAALNYHFSLKENLGDITAKYHVQGVAAYLIGMSLGIGLSAILSTSSLSNWILFLFLAAGHMFFGYRALQSVKFFTLNKQRTAIILDHYFVDGTVLSPSDIHHQQLENIIYPPSYELSPKLVLGDSVKKAFSDQDVLKDCLSLFRNESYIVNMTDNRISIILKENIQPLYILRAFFNGYYVRYLMTKGVTLPPLETRALLKISLEFTNGQFNRFLRLLNEKGWNTKDFVLAPSRNRAIWENT
eukprot:TRINITY_DN15645_c0_g1_i1.p1 TRINITY_DN15645_c0_g1~~TRINITY_DN15645_c0_g1_i1.p1  ORF type:complete len:273 (-),score=24.65 TRINITY_DN15645_c0_g1_i1:13-831(-)